MTSSFVAVIFPTRLKGSDTFSSVVRSGGGSDSPVDENLLSSVNTNVFKN